MACFDISEVELGLFSVEAFLNVHAKFGHAPLQALQQVLAVAFKNNLEAAALDSVNKYIGQSRLHGRVQMNFRLFQYYRASLWHIK